MKGQLITEKKEDRRYKNKEENIHQKKYQVLRAHSTLSSKTAVPSCFETVHDY